MSELTWQFQGDQMVNILSFPAEVSKTKGILSFGWMMPIVPFMLALKLKANGFVTYIYP